MNILPDDIIKKITEYISFEENTKIFFVINKDIGQYAIFNSILKKQYTYDNTIHHKYKRNFSKVIINIDEDAVNIKDMINLKKLTLDVKVYPNLSILHQHLQHLTLGDWFNDSVDHLPSSLTYLKFGEFFNHSVDKLPTALLELEFGRNFNQTVDNLPSCLTRLTFGDKFNQPVDKLPSNLLYVTFGKDFKQSTNMLPSSISYITLKNSFSNTYTSIPTRYQVTFNMVENNFFYTRG